MKAVLRGKFIAPSAYIRNLDISLISNLTAHMEALEQKELNSSRSSGPQKITKMNVEINKMESRRTTYIIIKTKISFFEKMNKID